MTAARTVWVWMALTAVALAAGLVAFAHLALGYGASAVLSDSMRPGYRSGDVMITRLTPVSDLRVGEIVAVTPPGEHASVAHRIVAISGDSSTPTLRTKGDANPAPDRWLEKPVRSQVPVAVGRVPLLGAPRRLVGSAQARVALIAAVGMCLTAWATARSLREADPSPAGGRLADELDRQRLAGIAPGAHRLIGNRVPTQPQPGSGASTSGNQEGHCRP